MEIHSYKVESTEKLSEGLLMKLVIYAIHLWLQGKE